MNRTTSDNNYVIGPLLIAISITSLWKINRNVNKLNLVLGTWLITGLFILDYTKTIAFFSTGACGTLIIILSAIKTNTSTNFGGGWRSLFQNNPPHLQEAEKIQR